MNILTFDDLPSHNLTVKVFNRFLKFPRRRP